VTVQYSGGTKAKAGAVIASGQYGTTDANGKFIPGVANQRVLVMAVEPSTADGDVIPVQIVHTVMPATLATLGDVTIAEPADTQTLKYDGTAKVWENAASA
jgi:hypothetical protein